MANETLVPDGLTILAGTWYEIGGNGTPEAADIDEGVGAADGTNYIYADFGVTDSSLAVQLPSRTLAGPFVRVSVKFVARKEGAGATSIEVTPKIDGVDLSTQSVSLTTDWQLFTLKWDGSWTAAQIDAAQTLVVLEQPDVLRKWELDAFDFVIYEEIPPDATTYQGGNLRVVVGNMCPRQASYIWPLFPY